MNPGPTADLSQLMEEQFLFDQERFGKINKPALNSLKSLCMNDQISQLMSAAAGKGIQMAEVTADNEIHRVPVQGKKGVPGWYVATEIDGKIFASFGDWSTGEKHSFKNGGDNTSSLTENEIAALKLIRTKARQARKKRQEQAAKESLKIWEKSLPAPEDHPYLLSKGIKPHGARIEENTRALLINLIGLDGKHSSFQRIKDPSQLSSEDEPSKKLFKYGKKEGCFHVIKGTKDRVYICEGYATGCSINEATGSMVVVAIDSGNLMSVAQGVKKIFDARGGTGLILAADNDHKKKKNIGLEKAKSVASATGIKVLYPTGIEGTDFNDMVAEKGHSYVKGVLLNERQAPSKAVTAIQPASSIKARKVYWRWAPMLANRKFHLLAARGGSAKTSISCDIAARVTTGGHHPMSSDRFGKGSVLYVSTEDEVDDTLLPRTIEAGGDPDKLYFLSSSKHHLDLNERPEELEAIIESLPDDLALIILDPVTSMTGDANTHVDSNVKRLAGVLSGIAMKHDLSILGIIHFRKGDPSARGQSLVDMVTGSAGWVNSARIALACFVDEKTDTGYLGVIKSNIGHKKYTLEYKVRIQNEIVKIEYQDVQHRNIEDIIREIAARENKESKKDTRQDRAINRIGAFFTEHGLEPAKQGEVRKYVKEMIGERITDSELREAERKGGYISKPGGNGSPWMMHPPGCKCEKCGS
ncbi:MAG: AAA family ATPase [Proteobacteria bacterium]|nr:AAA family ATPase [Pseudomonadota bacterium]